MVLLSMQFVYCGHYIQSVLPGTGYKGQNERLVEKLKKIRDKTSPLCDVKGQKSPLA